jgi:hypothetical protein
MAETTSRLLRTNGQCLTDGGCLVCFASLTKRDLGDAPDSYALICDECGVQAKPDYLPASSVVLIWQFNGYKVRCRSCDAGTFTVRELADAVACAGRYTSECFLCGRHTPAQHQVSVEVEGTTLSRLFACSVEHLDILSSQLRSVRSERCSGWCRRCNLTYSGDDSYHIYPRKEAVLHVRSLREQRPSWLRLSSWREWLRGEVVELQVEDVLL